MSKSSAYLSGLDSLRWYSAFAVIITHVELRKKYEGLSNVWDSAWVQNLGPAGVYFFFTLSGFLVTWLLQKERTQPLSTVLPDFYRRRGYRILPLYYFLVLLGFLVLPQFNVFGYSDEPLVRTHAAEFVAFISAQPHFASAFLQRVPNISHLWSIGVELTFYCFWPILILRSKNLKRTILTFCFAVVAIKVALLILGPFLFLNPHPVFHFAATLKFECMAIGAWFALPHGNRMSRILDASVSAWVAMAAVPLVFLLYSTRLDDVAHLPLSVVFGVIIRSAAFTTGSPIRFLDYRASAYLGRISYGIYCYHVVGITLMLNLKPMEKYGNVQGNLFLYCGTLIFTIAVSSASFHFFELPISRRARNVFAGTSEAENEPTRSNARPASANLCVRSSNASLSEPDRIASSSASQVSAPDRSAA
ncbi:MAG: acyltransferase [Fuerstiella sp.]